MTLSSAPLVCTAWLLPGAVPSLPFAAGEASVRAQVKELGGEACSVVGDLCDDSSCKNATKEAIKQLGASCTARDSPRTSV